MVISRYTCYNIAMKKGGSYEKKSFNYWWNIGYWS